MTVVETLLVFVGAPLVVFLLVAAWTLRGGRSRSERYRPGRPWEFGPVWYEPHRPGGAHDDDHDDHDEHAISTGARASALAIGEHPHRELTAGPPARTAFGGARGTW